MKDSAIRVERLGKLYRIGRPRERYETLRKSIMGLMGGAIRRLSPSAASMDYPRSIWALRDISLEIKRGDVLGIIGRNGAGKSTFLKILSRITEPTEGRVIVHGRVGSLLEVGTGFHPELTGRENVYLNGAILGMKRKEILQKFDEMVAFAEVEKFIDTPIKRYSSGMYLRLAFAVAAHLEPEILLVDEVLAVGDAAFQKKCLGKMGDVAREGRTVLFVSHNMGAVVSLCNRCVLFDQGSLIRDGSVSSVTAFYQSKLYPQTTGSADLTHSERYGTGKAKFISVKLTPLGMDGSALPCLYSGQDLKVEVEISGKKEVVQANVALIIYDSTGYRLIDVNTALRGSFLSLNPGEEARVVFHLQNVLLKPGTYLLGLWLGRGSIEDIDGITYGTSFSVETNPRLLLHSETFPGVYQCRFSHSIERVLPEDEKTVPKDSS